jgi:hypothetical protein
MAHSYHHAVSSARKWGGTAEDYLAIHAWSGLKRLSRTSAIALSGTMRRESGSRLYGHASAI